MTIVGVPGQMAVIPGGGTIAPGSITLSQLANISGLSVIGNAINATGAVTAISGVDGNVLRVAGTALGFGAIATAGIADAAVTYAKIQSVAALSVFGRASNSSGVGADITTSATGDVLHNNGTSLAFGQHGISWYGGGTDGAADFDGSTTVLGFAPSSGVYTITRDLFLTTCRIRSGATVNIASWQLFVNSTLTVDSGGILTVTVTNGGNASGTSPGSPGSTIAAKSSPGSVAVGGSGATGTTTTGGMGSSASSPSLGCFSATGSSGGSGGAGANAGGGIRGATTTTAANIREFQAPVYMLGLLSDTTVIGAGIGGAGGSAGGGNGAGNTSGGGGAGGSGGGWLVCFAKTMLVAGSIKAPGGNGGNGGNAAGTNAGGGGSGGGGSGGHVFIICDTIDNPSNCTAPGGSPGNGGSGAGGGANGNQGGIGGSGRVTIIKRVGGTTTIS